MATIRASYGMTGPTIDLYTYADISSQSQSGNYTTVYYYVQCINRGGTTTYSGYSGSQRATIGGQGGATHSASSLPSGYAVGATRWSDGPYGTNMGHDSAGNRGTDTVLQQVRGWKGSTSFARDDTGTLGGYPRIPKAPSVPGTPVASNVMPTSLNLTWTASTDNAGSAIDGYLVRRWAGSSATGTYVDVSQTNTLTRSDSGLTPGTTYTYGIYAHNGSYAGYSALSGTITVKTIAPMRAKVAGVWKYAVPYQKINGVWVMMQPYVKVSGVWKATA